MAISQSISLQQNVLNQVMGFASQYGVDGWVMAAIAQVASGGNQMSVTPYGIGVMGISVQNATALGFNANIENQNIEAGVAYFASLLSRLIGHYELALAAYVTSYDTVQTFNGVPPLAPVQNFVYNVSRLAAIAGSLYVNGQGAIKSQTTGDPDEPAPLTGEIIDPRTAGIRFGDDPAKGASNLSALQTSMKPVLQTFDNTLTATAWYADTGLITGNPSIRASVQPVTFTVYFDRNKPNSIFQNPATGQPIELQLNTSMTTFEIASKHVYNRTPSRTGMHITLWGMQPDMISGTGSTGVFMNQFGLTDFFSVANITDDVAQLLTSGFSHSFQRNITTATNTVVSADNNDFSNDVNVIAVQNNPVVPTGEVFTNVVQGSDSVASQAINAQGMNNPSEAFRVAAQDCFIEFLKLFQMNGSVYYYAQSYATDQDGTGQYLGTISGNEQTSATAWSPATGTTSFQQHSRNNDVMTRGYVSMRYRNNVYLGYFKSLSWTQDAESPYQWKFNFTFQVEKTYTSLYYPNVQVTQLSSNGTQ